MPVNINVVCTNDCGIVSIDSDSIMLFVSQTRPEVSHYEFVCPECGTTCTRPAPPPIVGILVQQANVVPFVYEPSPEMDEHPGPEVPPLTVDDLLDTMLEIEQYNLTGEGLIA